MGGAQEKDARVCHRTRPVFSVPLQAACPVLDREGQGRGQNLAPVPCGSDKPVTHRNKSRQFAQD